MKVFRKSWAHCSRNIQLRQGIRVHLDWKPLGIIIPITEDMKDLPEPKMVAETGVVVGDEVRIIREPYFGKIGTIKSLPSKLKEIETGAKVRIMDVELADGKVVTVPRANVEIIEV